MIDRLGRGLNVQVLDADPGKAIRGLDFNDRRSRWIEIPGIKRIGEWNIEGDAVFRNRCNSSLDIYRGSGPNPGLMPVVTSQIIHPHELHPGRCDRPPDLNHITGGEA